MRGVRSFAGALLAPLGMSGRRAVFAVLALAGLFVGLELRVVFGDRAAPQKTAHERAPLEHARVSESPSPDAHAVEGAPTTQDFGRRFPWSSSPSGLGRIARTEGNAEGPASLAAGPDGQTLVVDAVNGRILLLRGAGEPRSVKAPLAAIQDVVALPSGGFALLDRLVDRQLALVDREGHVFAKIPLPPQAGEPGLLTGVFANREVVCLEREHGACVPVATPKGDPAPSDRELPGRLASDGASVLHAGIVAPGSARVSFSRSDASPFVHRYTRELTFEGPVRSLEFLDANAAGELYVAVVLEGAPEAILVLCLATANGAERGRQALPASTLPDEITRSFAVMPDGGFLYLHRTVDGADLRRYRCAP